VTVGAAAVVPVSLSGPALRSPARTSPSRGRVEMSMHLEVTPYFVLNFRMPDYPGRNGLLC